MTNNNNGVDVLAVMRRDAEHAHEHRCDCPSLRDGAIAKQVESIEARAAVAELIAQRDMMANALVAYRKAGVGNSTDFMLQHEASQLAGIALARVGGAA